MAITADQIDGLTGQLVRLYGEAELVMLHRITDALANGLDSPSWAEEKLLEYQLLQARLRGDLNTLAGKSATEITRTILTAYNRGQATALGELMLNGLAEQIAAGANPAGLSSIRALLTETATSVLDSHQRILRSTADVYRTVIAEASPLQLVGAVTRKEAAQRALERAVERGVTSFVDARGRRWSMTAYTEMATRTAARRAQVQGHTDQLTAHGQDLVFVSNHSQECRLCRPWEGKVLSLSGVARIDDVQVAGTLDQARAAGLLHPGCRHTVGLYLPGVTDVPSGTADPAGDAARQEQRRLERGIREWKRREAVALDPEHAARARAKVRDWQGRLREHLDANPTLKRQRDRESIALSKRLGLTGGPAPVTSMRTREQSYWAQRQTALGIETHGDTLRPHEIEFVERMSAAGNQVEWIPKQRHLPTNDFKWGGAEFELKSVTASTATYDKIHGRIVDAASRAAKHGVVKDRFVIDIVDQELGEDLAELLAGFNEGRRKHRLQELWVMSRGALRRINLTK